MDKPGAEKFTALFNPGSIGNLYLDNRLIMAPMGNSLADNDGGTTQGLIDYYRERARGGVGLVITQFASVNYDDMMPYSLALYDDKFIPGMRRLVDTIHEHGAKACIQLMHPGMLLLLLRSIPETMTIKVPSIIPHMKKAKSYQEVTEEDIKRYVLDFAEAAYRVKESGADAVELHACHGCLVSTFLSPVTNRRTDRYGGNMENRTRFACEITERIKEKVGSEFPLTVRINGNDDVDGGVTVEEVVQQSLILESAGADAISISSGLEYWSALMAPAYPLASGVNVSVAEEVKQAVGVPVIVSGKIDYELADNVVSKGKADFITLGRPLLADPDLSRKLHEGRIGDVHRCLYCNNCLRSMWRSCTVNPFLYREAILPLESAESPRQIMVVGGGLAGMQTAVLLAMRGHNASLYEKGPRLGGQWYTASLVPRKQDFISLIDQLEHSLDKYGVPIALNTEINKEMVMEIRPDVVVVATGAIPMELDIPGANRTNVIQANDVLEGKFSVKSKVVVVGGRSLGMEVAILLAEQGKEVNLVSRSALGGKRGPDEKMTHRALMRCLVELRIPMYLNATLLEIVEGSAVLCMADEIFSLPADTVILAIGVKPVDTLLGEIEGIIPEVYSVGDCVQPGNAAQATFGAARLALEI
jgi:2,4-dienoyl-CoA reductase-like NADH-dependent reductase (Old Yellow Enzyme family)/thioredoxin reductase